MLLEDVIGTDNFLKAHKVLKEEVNILFINIKNHKFVFYFFFYSQ